jgi:hypothetical protein
MKFITSLLIFSSCFATAQSSEPFKYRIKLTIDEASIKEDYGGRLESALNRELRNLGDVVVVESDPYYELSLRLSSSYVLSSAVIQHFNMTEARKAVLRLTVDNFKTAGLPITDYFDVSMYTSMPPTSRTTLR